MFDVWHQVFTYPQGGIWVAIPPKQLGISHVTLSRGMGSSLICGDLTFRTGAALLFFHGQNAINNPMHYGATGHGP